MYDSPVNRKKIPRREPPKLRLDRDLTLSEKKLEVSTHSHASSKPETLKIISWNVWFDILRFDDRMQAIVERVLEEGADIICFQEVTPKFQSALYGSAHLNELFDMSPNTINSYGVMILAKKNDGMKWNFTETALPTRMGRSLITVYAADKSLAVGTVHLESLDNRQFREDQLKVIMETLQSFSSSVVCGDFNIDATTSYGDWLRDAPLNSFDRLENTVMRQILDGYEDCWSNLRPEEPGYTFDGSINVCVVDKKEVMRYDRIMAKNMNALEIEVIGTDYFDKGLFESAAEARSDLLGHSVGPWSSMQPSDHFGLACLFQLPPPVAAAESDEWPSDCPRNTTVFA